MAPRVGASDHDAIGVTIERAVRERSDAVAKRRVETDGSAGRERVAFIEKNDTPLRKGLEKQAGDVFARRIHVARD